MGKRNAASGFLILAAILLIAISTFMVVNYTAGALIAVLAFASTGLLAAGSLKNEVS